MVTNDKSLAMSPEEFSQATGLSLTYVYQIFRLDKLPGGLHPVKAGRRYLISRKAVEAWLEGDKNKEG
jgi:excisionase family DNA binding protein